MKNSEKLPQPKNYRFILFLQFLASVIFLFLAINYVPIHYLAAAGLILSLLIVLCSLLIFSMKSRFSRGLGRLLSLTLSVILFAGSAFIARSNLALQNVTKAEKETISVSVVVMKDSSAQTLEDVRNGIFGYNASYDE